MKRIIKLTLVVLMIALVLFGIANNGFTVTFDSRGGTDVAPQTNLMYGDPVQEPEPPTREGYTFAGWYLDENCQYLFDFDTVIIEGSTTLYARWEKN